MTLRLAALDELNARPLWFSLREAADIQLIPQSRMGATKMLEQNRVDLGIISVVKAAEEGWHRPPGVGIAASGRLDSVFLFSEGPPEDASIVYVASESRTSMMLMRALLRRRNRIPQIITVSAAEATAKAKADPGTAALIIGDDAMKVRSRFRHAWDLPETWNQITGLPIVMGVWASVRPLGAEVSQRLATAAAEGERQRSAIAAHAAHAGWIEREAAETYLQRLHYTLQPPDEAAIALLLSILHMYELIRLPDGTPTLDRSHRDMIRWMAV